MTVTIRLADPDRDFPRVAELLTAACLDPVSPEELREDEGRLVPGKIRRRLVAVDADEVVGHAWTVHYPSQSAGLFHVVVVVDSAYRRQGIGGGLYGEIERFARSKDASVLQTEVLEREQAGRAFAESRGFKVHRHAIAATLDLVAFDESRFAGLVEAIESTGIRFLSFADAGDTTENRRKLYEINRIAVVDDPAAGGQGFPEFDVWQGLILESTGFQPEGQLLAVDEDRYVGLSAINYDEETGTAHTLITGVHPDYRGRGLATALKLQAIRFARDRDAARIVTETDSRNAAMMRINQKLGFREEPGYYGLSKQLALLATRAGTSRPTR